MSSKKSQVPPTPLQKFVRTYLVWVVLIIIVVIIAGGYLAGYRFGPNMTLARVGSISLTNLPTGTSVYVDQVLRANITATSTKNIELVSGSHSIIVSATGDYPWNNLISVTSGVRTVVKPILIPEQPIATPLTGAAKATAIASIASTTIPTQTKPITLANGCAHVYVSNNQILADAVTAPGCTPPPYLCINGKCASTIIFSPVDTMTAVLPYPGRQDALLIGLNNVLYAIALDPRSPRFFAPVLGATSPVFGLLPNGTLVVQTITAVFSVKL